MPDQRSRILIAEDHCLLAELSKTLLEPEFNVVGIVNNGQELFRAARNLNPDVVIFDISMPILNGLDAGERVKEMLPSVKLLYLTMHLSEELAADAMLRGASGFLVKTCAASELTVAVRSVLRGECYMCPTISPDNVNMLIWERAGAANHQDKLTPRQRDVLQLLAEGMQMKQVGDILGIAPRTVAFHKYRMTHTVGAKSEAELIRYAIKSHMVSA